MYDVSRVVTGSHENADKIDYDEIIVATEGDVLAGRSHTLEETEAFGRAVVAHLLEQRSRRA